MFFNDMYICMQFFWCWGSFRDPLDHLDPSDLTGASARRSTAFDFGERRKRWYRDAGSHTWTQGTGNIYYIYRYVSIAMYVIQYIIYYLSVYCIIYVYYEYIYIYTLSDKGHIWTKDLHRRFGVEHRPRYHVTPMFDMQSMFLWIILATPNSCQLEGWYIAFENPSYVLTPQCQTIQRERGREIERPFRIGCFFLPYYFKQLRSVI